MVVGLLGLYMKFGFMLTAAGAIGKLQAVINSSSANRIITSLDGIYLESTGSSVDHIYGVM